jgi:hypothetical protein
MRQWDEEMSHHMSHHMRYLALLALLPLASCEHAAASSGAGAPAHQYIVGIDISASRTTFQLAEERQMIEGLIGRMAPGDRIVLIETYQTGVDSAGQWQDSIPAQRIPGTLTGKDRRNVEQFHLVASQIASTFFDLAGKPKVMSTDLFRTLYQAADYAKAANGRRTTVLLLSDMLQSTSEVNMEQPGGIPAAAWVDGRKAEGRLPDLRNVCVFVVGADPTTRAGARVRAFWEHYFDAAGATFKTENYRSMVADAREIGCE